MNFRELEGTYVKAFYDNCQAQYIFIHDALDELITCGETAFNVQSLRVKISRMSKVVPGTNKTGFQDQFEVCICICMSVCGLGIATMATIHITNCVSSYVHIYYHCILQLLQSVSRPVTSDDCSDALSEHNKEKNFSINLIPCKIVVYLSSIFSNSLYTFS